MTDAERFALQIQKRLPGRVKSGALCFWGEWFGRPYDNYHQVVGCEAEQDLLRLHFDEGETLCVWAPRTLTLNEQTFEIMDATQVRWEWFYYGRPKLATNRYFMEFTKTETGIVASTNVDWYTPDLKPSSKRPAVEIL